MIGQTIWSIYYKSSRARRRESKEKGGRASSGPSSPSLLCRPPSSSPEHPCSSPSSRTTFADRRTGHPLRRCRSLSTGRGRHHRRRQSRCDGTRGSRGPSMRLRRRYDGEACEIFVVGVGQPKKKEKAFSNSHKAIRRKKVL